MVCTDTPWDEPTENSPEFGRYLEGIIFQDAPWHNFSEQLLCTLQCLLVFCVCSAQVPHSAAYWTLKYRPATTTHHRSGNAASLVCTVSHLWSHFPPAYDFRSPSQLPNNPIGLATRLTQPIWDGGDMDIASPDFG